MTTYELQLFLEPNFFSQAFITCWRVLLSPKMLFLCVRMYHNLSFFQKDFKKIFPYRISSIVRSY